MPWINGEHCRPVGKTAMEKLSEVEGTLDDEQARWWFADFCRSNISFTTQLLLGVTLDPWQIIKISGMLLRNFCADIEGRGVGKSFCASVYIVLYCIFNPGVKLAICSGTYRQSKLIFKQIEKWYNSPRGKFFRQCVKEIRHDPDGYSIEFTNGSLVMALPLTDKIRGYRFNKVIIEEYIGVPKEIIETVIAPFMTAVQMDHETEKIRKLEDDLIRRGLMSEDERRPLPQNSFIALSSASFKFEDLYKVIYKGYTDLICDPNAKNVNHFVFRISYEAIQGFGRLDMNFIENMKAVTSKAQFDKEYRAIFGDEGAGYFSWKSLQEATIPVDQQPMIKIKGDSDKKYILAIDPNYSESETADHFAMALLELNEQDRSGTLVHCYALASSKLNKRSEYLKYLLDYFNIVYIIVDNAGGPKFISDAREFLSGFTSRGSPRDLLFLEDTFLDGEDGIRAAQRSYNLVSGRILHSQVFGRGGWIDLANQTLQYHIENKKIKFGGRLGDRGIEIIRHQSIPIDDLEFDGETYSGHEEKLLCFGDHQNELIDLTKKELTLIEVSSNMSGQASFDLAKEVKGNKKDPTRARRDSYTALLLASYGMSCYWKIISNKTEEEILMPVWLP